jgi:hypothetical protein
VVEMMLNIREINNLLNFLSKCDAVEMFWDLSVHGKVYSTKDKKFKRFIKRLVKDLYRGSGRIFVKIYEKSAILEVEHDYGMFFEFHKFRFFKV